MDKRIIRDVKNIVTEVEKTHRYSMSRIYGLYNEVFGKNETPQSCASCLIRKVNELKKWLENFSEEEIAEAFSEVKVEAENTSAETEEEVKPQAPKRGRKKKGA